MYFKENPIVMFDFLPYKYLSIEKNQLSRSNSINLDWKG